MATTTEHPPVLDTPNQPDSMPEDDQSREGQAVQLSRPTDGTSWSPQFSFYVSWRTALAVTLTTFLILLLSSLALLSNHWKLPQKPAALVKDAVEQLPPLESPVPESDSSPPPEDFSPGLTILHTPEGVILSWPIDEEPHKDNGSDPDNSTKLNATGMLPWEVDALLKKSADLPRSGRKCCPPPLCCDLETATACYRKCQGDYILALFSGAPVCPSLLSLEARLAACNATVGPGGDKQYHDNCGVVGTLKTAWHTLLCLAPFWTLSTVFLTVLLLVITIRVLVSRLVLRVCPCAEDQEGEGRPGLLGLLKHSMESHRQRMEAARANTSLLDDSGKAYEIPAEMLLKPDIEDMTYLKFPEQTLPDQEDLSSYAAEGYGYYPARSDGQSYARTPQQESYGHPEASENADDTPNRPAVNELKKRFEDRRQRQYDERLDRLQHGVSAPRKSSGDDEGLEEDETLDQDMYDDYIDEYLMDEESDEDFSSNSESSGEEMEIQQMEKVRADLARIRKEMQKQSQVSSPNSDPHGAAMEPSLRSI